jgi:hypothetical protein
MTATSEQELLLIGETWAPAIAGSVRDVLDPASGEVIAQVADASPGRRRRRGGPGPGGVRRRGLGQHAGCAAGEDPVAGR